MANRTNKKRTCVMIVEQDLEFGIKLADWLAAHGYQAVLVRSMETAIDECRDLRPQAVFIGLGPSEPVATFALRRLFRMIKITSSHVPVVTMGGRTDRDQTDIPSGGSLRHVHLSVKPAELTYIGRLLRSELSAATAVPTSPSMESGPPDRWGGENPAHARAGHSETALWIG